VAIAALVLWLCTAAVGSYLLLIGVRSANAKSPAQEPVAVAAERHAADGQAAASAQTPAAASAQTPAAVSAQTPAAVSAQTPAAVSAQAAAAAPARPARDKDRWDPPSLQRAKSEPLPGLRDLAEFAHPALAITGFAFWLCYVLSRDRVFAVIGLGILLGAICAGLSWFTVNKRAARRAASGRAGSGAVPLAFPPRLVALHAAGAVLTVLFAVLIAVRV